MFYVFSGLPGTGKTTLARSLAHTCAACLVRIDPIEQVLRDTGVKDVGPHGYEIGAAIAWDNLRLGRSVIADSVNPIRITRELWRRVAVRTATPFREIEVVCTDRVEHRRRIETRVADIAGFALPTWDDVLRREYESWDRPRIVIDTAGATPEESAATLLVKLEQATSL